MAKPKTTARPKAKKATVPPKKLTAVEELAALELERKPPQGIDDTRWWEHRALKDIKPHPDNARDHPEAQIKLLANAIKEFGFYPPILVDEKGFIVAGHGRLLAAQSLGRTDAPVAVVHGWSEKKKRAYRLADNRLAMMSTWDQGKLRNELIALDIKPTELGFSKTELARLEIPGFELKTPQVNLTPSFEIIVTCKDEKDQERLLGELARQGLECKPLVG